MQRQVWETLLRIPYGQTWSYGQVAAAIDRPRAARPVGQAVGANPIGIIVPCHRVIGAGGALTGFGGGLWRKRRLLTLERDVSTAVMQQPGPQSALTASSMACVASI